MDSARLTEDFRGCLRNEGDDLVGFGSITRLDGAPEQMHPRRYLWVACGPGQLGWHTMLLTPQFKTRQKLVSIATSAPLVPDPVQCTIGGKRLCGAGTLLRQMLRGMSWQRPIR